MLFCLVPVQFTASPQNLTVNETNPIVVSCDASGFPEPSFTWRKDGQLLSQPKKLSIPKSDRGDAGMYECTASNGVGQDKTAEAYVTVQCKSTCLHVIELLVAEATWLSNVAAKELIFCVTVNCIPQSYNVPSRIKMFTRLECTLIAVTIPLVMR